MTKGTKRIAAPINRLAMTTAFCHYERSEVIRNTPKNKELRKINYYVYILANNTNVAIYTGVTRNLIKRVYEHKNNLAPNSFTAKYNIHKLVYFETTTDVYSAISREKQIKAHSRKWKNDLVNSMNPKWEDLYESILG